MTNVVPSVLRPQHPVPRLLSGLVDEFELGLRGDIDGLEVTGVSLSSPTVQPGDLFVGVPGRNSHGASFAEGAAGAGAVAILTDDAGAVLAADSSLPVLVTPDARAALGADVVVVTDFHPRFEGPAARTTTRSLASRSPTLHGKTPVRGSAKQGGCK